MTCLLDQGCSDANITYGVVNTRERNDPLNQENSIISPVCNEMYKKV